jgi:hypothetical protein
MENLRLVPSNPRRNTSIRIFDSWRSGDKANMTPLCLRFFALLGMKRYGVEIRRRQVSTSEILILNHAVSMPEKSDAIIEWRQSASVVISGCVKNLPFPERNYRKTPSLSLRLRVQLRPRREEIKRKCVSCLFPLRFHFISACGGWPD